MTGQGPLTQDQDIIKKLLAVEHILEFSPKHDIKANLHCKSGC